MNPVVMTFPKIINSLHPHFNQLVFPNYPQQLISRNQQSNGLELQLKKIFIKTSFIKPLYIKMNMYVQQVYMKKDVTKDTVVIKTDPHK